MTISSQGRIRIAKWIFWAAVAFLFVSNQIVLLPSMPNWYDQQRLLALLLLSGSLGAYALSPQPPTAPSGALLLLTCIGLSLLSPLPGWALAETSLMLGLVVLTSWVNSACRSISSQQSNMIAIGLIMLGAAISLRPLMQYIVSLCDSNEFTLSTLFTGFSNHRFFSQAESVLIPLMTIPASLLTQRPMWQRLGNVVACLLWVMAFASGTRAFYVAMTGTLVVALIWGGSYGRKWTRIQCQYLAFGALGYGLLFWALPAALNVSIFTDNARLATVGGALDSSGRIAMWQTALSQLLTHPLLGIGPMHFATLTQSASTPGFAAHPHNALIQLLVEWGLLVGGFVLVFLTWAFYRFWHAAATPQTRYLGFGIFNAALYSLFDGSVVTPYTQVLLAILLGWAWSYMPARRDESDYGEKKPCISSTLLRLTCLMAAIYLAWMALSPIDRISPHTLQYLENHPAQPLWPRFWSQGLINLSPDFRYPSLLFHQ